MNVVLAALAINSRPGEFLGELFGQSVRGRVCYLIDVLFHLFPGPGLGLVLAIIQLLDLLDVMAADGRRRDASASIERPRDGIVMVRKKISGTIESE